jgi:hypothetical protein
MSLAYIIRRVASDAGITSPDLNSSQRAWLVDIINQAANEYYNSHDIPAVLKECFVRATADAELVLPPFIGELRAIRGACCSDIRLWTLTQMRPKYHKDRWQSYWDNFEEKGDSVIEKEITNTAPGTIVYPIIDTDLTITFVGETIDSNRAIENVVMTTATKAWTKNFFEFKRIAKNKVTDYNIIINDSNGNELSIIYADQLEARFRVVDVSKYPTLTGCVCSDGTYAMEILYKPLLTRLEHDEDSFPVQGYDDIIALKTRQLIAELDPEKTDRAILMHKKAELLSKQKESDKNGQIQKRFSFGKNPLLGMFDRTYNNPHSDTENY